FKGNFSSIDIIKPSDSKYCEIIVPHEKTNSDKTLYKVTFSIDKSNCSKFKWWMILLIVVGILLVITLVFIISVYKIKSLREKIFPYNKRKNQNVESESSKTQKSELYHNKSKVNPIYQ